MVLKVSMPSTSGYASSAQNLSNIAAIIQSQRTAQANKEAAANTKIFRQQQLQQGNERLDLARSEQAYAQGADERAIVADQGIFNRDKARRMEANRGITSILNDVKNDPTQAYTPNAEVDQALLNSPGYKSMVAGVAQTGAEGNQTAAHLDALLAQEDLFQGRRDEVASHPNLFRDPKQITQDVARRARETGNYDETQIQAMQETALADAGFGSLSPETQKQLFAEQENILKYGSKLYDGGAGGNTTNNFGAGFNTSATSASQTDAFLKNFYEGKGIEGKKGWIEKAFQNITPNFLNDPNVSKGELNAITGASQAQSGIGKIHTINAMLDLNILQGDGTWSDDIEDLLGNPEIMTKIKLGAQQHQAAAAKQRVGGASGQSLANSQGMGKLLSNYSSSNAAIRAAGTHTKRTLAQSLQDAGNYAAEQTGVAADFGLGKSASTRAPKFGGGESDLINTGNDVSQEEGGALTAGLAKTEYTSILPPSLTPKVLTKPKVKVEEKTSATLQNEINELEGRFTFFGNGPSKDKSRVKLLKKEIKRRKDEEIMAELSGLPLEQHQTQAQVAYARSLKKQLSATMVAVLKAANGQ